MMRGAVRLERDTAMYKPKNYLPVLSSAGIGIRYEGIYETLGIRKPQELTKV